MRSLIVVVLLAACSRQPASEGALVALTNHGVTDVDHVELVLAMHDGSSAAQRLDEASVTPAAAIADYYRQVASGGTLMLSDLGSGSGANATRTVLIEPSAAVDVDTSSVELFVIAYNAGADVTGIGTFLGGGTTPSPIAVTSAGMGNYAVDLFPATVGVLGEDFAANAVAVVPCDGRQATFSSGVAWQPAAADATSPPPAELRVMFPDTSADPNATSAISRTPFDLDCDGALAFSMPGSGSSVTGDGSDGTAELDCDDLRADTHPGATELCTDGRNTSCDGHARHDVPCTPDATAYTYLCGTAGSPMPLDGSQVCDESTTPSTSTACVPDVTCACEAGSAASAGCNRCKFTPASVQQTPCLPAFADILLPNCAAQQCTASIVGVSPPWQVTISGASAHVSTVSIEATTSGNLITGAFYLSISGGTAGPQLFGYELAPSTGAPPPTCLKSATTGQITMACNQPGS